MKIYYKNLINRVAAVFNLRIVKSKIKRWDLHLYNSQSEDFYVNIGSGDFYHPKWINLDKDSNFYRAAQNKTKYIPYDLCKLNRLPFENASVNIFYTSHTLEHIADENVIHLFNEIYRCLKPGGVLRITCPNMELQYLAYGLRDNYFWEQPSPWHTKLETIEERFLEGFATVMVKYHSEKILNSSKFITPEDLEKKYSFLEMEDFFNSIVNEIPKNINAIYPEGHCNWFTLDKISNYMKSSGFSKIIESAYGQSLDPKMRNTDLFDSTCPNISLYVEAIK